MNVTRNFWLAALIATAAVATASRAEARVDVREHRQVVRIRDGRESGALTRRETARLAAREAHIRREEARYRASGDGLGPRERRDLYRDLNRTSRAIRRQKHDSQTRP